MAGGDSLYSPLLMEGIGSDVATWKCGQFACRIGEIGRRDVVPCRRSIRWLFLVYKTGYFICRICVNRCIITHLPLNNRGFYDDGQIREFWGYLGFISLCLLLITAFLDRRLRDVQSIGRVTGNISEYLSFTAHAVKNIANSRGIRL